MSTSRLFATITLLVGLLVTDGVASAQEQAEPKQRFDPRVMPPVDAPQPELGWRYGELSQAETRSLRQGFKLPMEALSRAQSTADLLAAAVTSPLPDPTKPILPAEVDPSAGNPFASRSLTATSFRADPMRALGELLGATEADAAVAVSDDPFAAPTQAVGPTSSGAEEASVDPFADSSDPFGADDSEDPFSF